MLTHIQAVQRLLILEIPLEELNTCRLTYDLPSLSSKINLSLLMNTGEVMALRLSFKISLGIFS